MRIASVRLTNWIRFRGVHALDLEPRVYGVVAKWEGDAERSNWGGKSAFLAAVRFALFGNHPADTEDEWITHGEQDGGVLLVLDTGERIERSRIRGKATRLRLDADGWEYHDEEAQREIVRRVGLTDKDFAATCFFEQKTFARFVTARPAQRMEIVRAWLDLDPLYGARDRVATDLRQLLKDEAALGTRLAGEQQRERETLATVGGQRAVLPERTKAANDRADVMRERMVLLERNGEEAAQRRRDASDLARWVAIASELKDAATGQRGASNGQLVQLRRELSVAEVSAAEAGRVARQARTLAAGQFDGGCPVLAGLDCPATERINGARETNRLAYQGANARHEAATLAASRAGAVVREAEAEESAAARQRGRLEALAAEQARLAPAAERARRWAGLEPVADGYAELSQLRLDERAARREADDIERAIVAFEAGDRRRETITRELGETRAAIVARQEALAALALARRTIASDALEQIAARANGLLSEAGFDLSLEVSWFRELRGQLAAACDACGAPFPTSQRVKECASCSAERGPKVAEELELSLSSRSGAADDMGGLVFCLAAGAWLRTQRGSGWQVCFLDEPASALDATHRRLLAAHLQSMLASRHGFSQGFVVSHEQGFVESLPGLIVVSAGPEFSSVEVSR